MTPQELEKQLAQKFVDWSKGRFDLIEMPEYTISLFKKAIFNVPLASHLLKIGDVQGILGKKPTELSIIEVGHVANIITAARPVDIFESLEDLVEKGDFFTKLKDAYNKMVEEKTQLLKREGAGKMKLLTK